MGLRNLTKTVTASGTPERLSTTSTPITGITIITISSNTGGICLGDSSANAKHDTAGHAFLPAGVPLSWGGQGIQPICDLSDIWIDSEVNGEGVLIWYWTTGV